MMTLGSAMNGALNTLRQTQARDDHSIFEERAAIIQFDGKVSREKAEQMARQQIWEARHKENNAPLFR